MRLADLPSCFVSATDTDAGKTWFACRLLRQWKNGSVQVAACKPVASGAIRQAGRLVSEDAAQLAASSGQTHDEVAGFVFDRPASPHIADEHGEFDLRTCVQQIQDALAYHQKVVVEGVGGWCVPLSETVMQAELVRASGLPVVLVVPIRLGCINHALLSAEQIRRDGCCLLGWYANRIDPDFADFEANVAAIAARIQAPRIRD